jgi:hypothetical protein
MLGPETFVRAWTQSELHLSVRSSPHFLELTACYYPEVKCQRESVKHVMNRLTYV